MRSKRCMFLVLDRFTQHMTCLFVTHDLSSSLTSSQVGGVGLTLTAANHVIHFDRPYNPAREDQAQWDPKGRFDSADRCRG